MHTLTHARTHTHSLPPGQGARQPSASRPVVVHLKTIETALCACSHHVKCLDPQHILHINQRCPAPCSHSVPPYPCPCPCIHPVCGSIISPQRSVEMSEQIKGDFVFGIGDLGFFCSCVGLCATWECAYHQH